MMKKGWSKTQSEPAGRSLRFDRLVYLAVHLHCDLPLVPLDGEDVEVLVEAFRAGQAKGLLSAEPPE